MLNAANEVAVEAFLANRIAFTAIPEIVEITLTAADSEGLLARTCLNRRGALRSMRLRAGSPGPT